MNDSLQNTVELRNHLRRYCSGNVLETIYYAIPDKQKAPFLEYRKNWTEADKKRIDLPFPLCISLELVANCNLRCGHCIRNRQQWQTRAPMLFKKARLGFATYKRITDECVEHGLPSLWLGCSGEALLEKDLCKMVKYAYDQEIFDLILTSNGTLLTKRIIDELLDIPITRIYISVDALTEETYQKVRGGNFDGLMSNIHYLLKRRSEKSSALPIVRLTFIDMPKNRHEKDTFVNYWKDKVELVDIQKFIDFDIQPPQEKDTVKPFHCSCPWRLLVIMANGDVIPCNSFFAIPELIMGNIHENSIKEIWDSERLQNFRHSLSNQKYSPACYECFAAQEKA